MLFPAMLPPAPSLAYTYRNVEIVGGGFVTGVIPHPKEKDLVYARTDIGGAYRWNPKTSRWIPMQDWLTRKDWNLYGVESLAADPSDPNRVYLATGTYTNDWAGNGAILRSVDRGKTWRRTDLTFKNGGNMPGRSMGERLAVDPNDGRVLFFGSRTAGLQRSSDHGETWSRVAGVDAPANGIGVTWTLFDSASGSKGSTSRTIYTGVGTSVLRSRDAGATWAPVSGGPSGLMAHQAKRSEDGTLVIAYGSAEGPNDVLDGAVWRLDPRTDAWTDLTPERPGPGNTFGYGGVSVRGDMILASTLCRWAKGDTVFRSTDGGKTWTTLKETAVRNAEVSPYLNWINPEPEFGHWIGDVEIDPFRPERAWYVTGATIWGTDDLGAAKSRWTPRAEGLEETAVSDLASPPIGAPVVSGLLDIGGFRHDNLDVSPVQGIWRDPVMVSTTDLDYAGTTPSVFARVGIGRGEPTVRGAISSDGGSNWTPFATSPVPKAEGGMVALSADGGVLAWAPYWGIDEANRVPWFSRDRGATWTKGDVPPAQGHVVADRVIPGAFAWLDGPGGRVFLTRDGGKSFSPGATGLATRNETRMVSVLNHAEHLWVPTAKGLKRSTDGGRTFTRVRGLDVAESVGFGRAASGASYPAAYVIGTAAGVEGIFRSTDAGTTWIRVNDEASGFGTMQRIEGDPKVFGRFYIGTNGRGILVAEPKSAAR